MALSLRDRIEAAITPLEGWCTVEKGTRLAQLVIEADGELTVELGVFGGRSAIAMAIGHQALGKGHVAAVDAWDVAAALDGANHPRNDAWWARIDMEAIHRGFVEAVARLGLARECRIVRARSEAVARLVGNGSIAVLHQDSNHSEKISVAEVLLWTPKIRAGGLWVMDDTDWPTMQAARSLLTQRGFTVVERHVTWQVSQKL